jgi:hypothetical protein
MYFEGVLTENDRLESRHPDSAVSDPWVSYIWDTKPLKSNLRVIGHSSSMS